MDVEMCMYAGGICRYGWGRSEPLELNKLNMNLSGFIARIVRAQVVGRILSLCLWWLHPGSCSQTLSPQSLPESCFPTRDPFFSNRIIQSIESGGRIDDSSKCPKLRIQNQMRDTASTGIRWFWWSNSCTNSEVTALTWMCSLVILQDRW